MIQKMIRSDCITKENVEEHNPNCPQIPDHPNRILIIVGSGSWKTNSSFNLIDEETNIDKIYLYAKDAYEAKYQFLINRKESTGLKHFNDSKAFIEYTNDMNDVYESIEEYNSNKKRKILIVFDDTIAGMISNKKLNLIVTEIFIRGRKLNICFVFITQSYFAMPKGIRLHSTYYFIMKIPNKQELQQIAFNHSSNIDFKNFMNLYKKCNAKTIFFFSCLCYSCIR